jgi:hypothetical protein
LCQSTAVDSHVVEHTVKPLIHCVVGTHDGVPGCRCKRSYPGILSRLLPIDVYRSDPTTGIIPKSQVVPRVVLDDSRGGIKVIAIEPHAKATYGRTDGTRPSEPKVQGQISGVHLDLREDRLLTAQQRGIGPHGDREAPIVERDVSSPNVRTGSVELQGTAHLAVAWLPHRAAVQGSVVTTRIVIRDRAGGFIQLPPAHQTGVCGPSHTCHGQTTHPHRTRQ